MTDTTFIRKAQAATDPADRRFFMRQHKALKIRDEIAACTNCKLSATRINTVPFDNDTPVPLAIVGEAPGVQEDKAGVPFVGRSGKLLDKMIEATGNTRSETAVLNTVACRPPHNRRPKPDESAACRPLFDKQLDFTGAWVVLLMGNAALSQIRPNVKISTARGTPFWYRGRIYIPTYHPAYVLRNPKMRKLTERDIGLAFKIVNGVEWWEPKRILQLAKPDKESQDLTRLLDAQGWAVVDSVRLQDTILVVKDDMIQPPTKYGALPRYSVQELVRLGELGGSFPLTTSELHAIHLTKRLGGVVVK